MEFWRHMAECYEHFTPGKGWKPDRKRELFNLLMDTLSGGGECPSANEPALPDPA
jgi:hypothetical protein